MACFFIFTYLGESSYITFCSSPQLLYRGVSSYCLVDWQIFIPLTGATLPRVPIDTGIEGAGTNGYGLTSVWRGIIDLLELLGDPYIRNRQRWNLIKWSLIVKSCFSGPGQKWDKKSGLAGGGEFYGFPAYFKGGPGQVRTSAVLHLFN